MDWRRHASVLAAALWWGSLTIIGFLVVPLLFLHLPTPAQAGTVAARIFSAQTWVTLGCGLVLLLSSSSRAAPVRMDWARGALLFLVTGMLLALLVEFAVAPRIVARNDVQLWHMVGTAMYGLQWVCALVVLWKVSGDPPQD